MGGGEGTTTARIDGRATRRERWTARSIWKKRISPGFLSLSLSLSLSRSFFSSFSIAPLAQLTTSRRSEVAGTPVGERWRNGRGKGGGREGKGSVLARKELLASRPRRLASDNGS